MNKDQKRRDEIMALEKPKYVGGLQLFDELTSEQLETLIKEDFIDETHSHCGAPTVKEFLEFMKNNEGVLAHGYLISADRLDYRMCIEGLTFSNKTTEEFRKTFVDFCNTATDCKIDKYELYSWWGK